MEKCITTSLEETQKHGQDLARKLKGGEVLALYGDLGSGKTTFMQGLAQGLGVKRRIISPTFIIMRTYEVKTKDKELRIKNLYHLDLYRIESEQDIEGLGLIELLGQKENVVAIEWPDKIKNVLPENRIEIYFEYLKSDQRSIRYSS